MQYAIVFVHVHGKEQSQDIGQSSHAVAKSIYINMRHCRQAGIHVYRFVDLHVHRPCATLDDVSDDYKTNRISKLLLALCLLSSNCQHDCVEANSFLERSAPIK